MVDSVLRANNGYSMGINFGYSTELNFRLYRYW